VDTPAVTTFVIDGLHLLLTVAVWYLLLTTTVTALAALPRVGATFKPLTRRLTDASLGVTVRRVLATSAVVGVSLPAAAGAEPGEAEDDAPIMIPIDPTETERSASTSSDRTTIREAETPTPSADDGHGQRPRPTDPAQGAPTDQPGTDREGRAPSTTGSTEPSTEAPDMRREEPSPRGAGSVGPGTNDADAPGMSRSSPSAPTASAVDADQDRHDRSSTPFPTGRPVRSARHVVEAGESFWTVAEDLVLVDTDGAGADLAVIAETWQQLIDHNADILVDPGNPDLLHPGQVVDLSGLD
jgi:hypothetical protein